jgi:integrase/recombinase XerD
MSPTNVKLKWPIASVVMVDAYTDFILSRQAMNCTPPTMFFYNHTAGVFLAWVEQQGIINPDEVSPRYVRQYLAELAGRGLKDTTLHAHARAIRTLLKFWHNEGYIPAPVKFDMPRLEKKRLPVLTADQLQTIIQSCNVRDRAIVMFMADSGLRRAETVRLNWGDVDMANGLVRAWQGKGKKDRSAVVGATTRWALLKYRRTLENVTDNAPLFQTKAGAQFVSDGFVQIFNRITKRTGIYVTPHALRRTFVILSLRNGTDVLHLQAMLGHASLDMVYHYAQMTDEDLLQAHREHGPIDNL